MDAPTSYNQPNRKTESVPFKPYRSKPYSKLDNHRINVVEDDEDEEPRLSEYCFSIYTMALLFAMQDLGEKARWPRKLEKSTGWKDKSKWCAFHEDFDHVTEDCNSLRKEMSYLLSKGHLKEFLGKRREKAQDHVRIQKRATSPLPDAKVINFISGGSDICGTSYSAAKRNAKEAKTEKGDRPTKTSTLTEKKVISFDEEDINNVQDPHHDSLVITLYIANHFIRKILIDGGSSLNIIQLEVLKRMGIPDSKIISKSSVLVGFSGEDVKEVSLSTEDPDVMVLVGISIPTDIEQDIVELLKSRVSTFAWKHEDMTGMIREVKFPRWLANVVVVQKKNGKWRVCVDFTDLNKASATYQRLVNTMFKEKLGDTMEVYIDDMVVKSKKAEDHLMDLRDAFDILDQYNMKLNPSKCHFGVGAGKFLGYMKKKIFEWEEKHEQALYSLKEYLSSAPLLMKPEDGEPLSLYLAVSRNSVSAVLVKDHEGQQHPAYYPEMSGRMADFSIDIQHEANLEVQQLEESKDKWIIFTDGSSNVTNNEAEYEALIAGLQQAWDMKIRYLQVPREDNAEADALANLASALKIPEGIKIPIIHILSPAIEEINEDGEIPSDEKNHKAFRMKVSRFIILHNVLYRKSIAGPYLICLEDPEAHEVLKDVHEDRTTTNNATGQTTFSLVDLAKVRIVAYQQKIAKSYNKNVRIRRFQVGDLVLRKAFQNTTNPSDGKLAPKWEGLYLIDSEAGKGAYWLTTMEGDIRPRSWNAIHLKAYFMFHAFPGRNLRDPDRR
ncbi:hypothetical protein L1987_06426 [Smallanthus sonchifolius]|uniref:Uncharacterized protein n=1 Tax=Smallanthus sonchifolius TaxID=185202 RepID=A0ACB9JY39_9ASTR|nr:hypothetical protein L1987_06426 [Smallanthus sonchifolius]